MRSLSTGLALAALILASPALPAQAPTGVDPTLLTGLTFRNIGPTGVGGRVDDIEVARTNGHPDAIYVGGASGGVFKSVDGGVSWTPIFDRVDGMMSIGDIAVAPSAPNVVWVGTGEGNNRQSSSWGSGVYKSTDAGATWTAMGLVDTHHIGRIVVDPADPNIVFVAAQGHLWGPNPERGVFKTTDGGASWKNVLFVDENTGANDVAIDPANPRTLFASTYQRQRTSWGYAGGGPGSGIYRSTDEGDTWTKLSQGLPTGDLGRIGLSVFTGSPTLVYAIVEARAGESGLYRSADEGATWTHLSPQEPRPSYYSQIRVDPKDQHRLYELGSNRGFYVSDDGGANFRDIFASAPGASKVHGEDHALWVDPDDPSHLIVGGDGGVSISWDRGETWDFRNNIPLGQFYEIDADDQMPYVVCGGLQDNGEWCVPSAVRDRNGIANRDSWNIGGGDGFYVKFDRTDETYAYAESQNGGMGRVNLLTLERQNVRPPAGGRDWNWDTPIVVSSHDAHVLYTGSNMLYRSTDRGTTWTAISGDLTSGVDPATLPIMGAPVSDATLSRDDGTSPFDSLTSISESPLDASLIYTGAQDGTVEVTKDGGKTWTNLTARFSGVPKYTYVSTVLASKYTAGRVYVTFDGHYTDDFKPYVFVSEDFGQTWRSLAAGLPPTSINRIREHPRNPRFLVLAHERGVDISNDLGQTWIPLALATNLPPVPVDDALIQPRDNALVLGSHGRGIWILDDVGPLELLTPDTLAKDAALAPIAPAHEIITHNVQAWYGAGEFFAPNPSFDAGITYYVRNGASGDATIEIRNAAGALVRTLSGPAATGLNHMGWDLHAEPPAAAPGQTAARGAGAGAGARGGRGGAPGAGGTRGAGAPVGRAAGAGQGRGGRGGFRPSGPLVPLGRYTVTVTIPGVAQPLRGQITVAADPIGTTKR